MRKKHGTEGQSVMDDNRLILILKVQQWEKCKGELNALVALAGSQLSEYIGNEPVRNQKWEMLEREIKNFVSVVEDEGWQE